jgi:nitroreductase
MINEIRTRRSIRKYTEQPVGGEIVMQLLESARLAPSGSNTQPWHFIVVRSESMRQQLAKVAHSQKWMAEAPVHIVCVADVRCRISDSEPVSLDETSPLVETKQIIRDMSIAVEHIVLEAESLGLGTCWIAWFEQKDIRPVLNIPSDKYVLCILTVGYPGEKPAARPRKKLEDIVHYESW